MLAKILIIMTVLGCLCGCDSLTNFYSCDDSIQETLCSSCSVNDTPYNPDCDLNRTCENDVDP